MKAREEAIAKVEDAIWRELERQAEAPMGPWVDRSMGMVDASGAGLDMTRVAAAAFKAVCQLLIELDQFLIELQRR